jgi:hypothetical protein
MGSSWYEGKYKNTRKQVLFESEKAKSPETMIFAQQYKLVSQYEDEIQNLQDEYNQKLKEFQEFKEKHNSRLRQLTILIYNINRGNDAVPPEAIDTGGLSDKKTKTATKLYTKCPVQDCPGMLNENNKCITCDVKVCVTCFEVKKDDHKCDPNTVETLKLLKKDTKNCPGCATPIHKIEGCYQMWCTNCHITFHYRTLEILNEKIHNPHYVDWLKNNTTIQAGGGDGCQALGYYSFNPFKHDKKELYRECCDVFGHITHIEAVDLGQARRQLDSFTSENSKRLIRAQYMIGKIDEKKYKMLLFKSYKQIQRWGDVVDLLNMYITTLKQLLHNAVATRDLNSLKTQINTVSTYVKEEQGKIAKLYGNHCEFRVLKI